MKNKYTYLLIVVSFLFVSCKGGQPKVVSDLKFNEAFEELTKKFGNFEVDNQSVCKTPPNCDFFYQQRKKVDGCLWRGIKARADQKSGKTTWVYMTFAGKCNGKNDHPLAKEFFSKDDPTPTYMSLDKAYGHNHDAGKDNTMAIWETSGAYVWAAADCYNTQKKEYETNFMDCRILTINIQDKGETKTKEHRLNNFKFHD